jgi:hypothetical protein
MAERWKLMSVTLASDIMFTLRVTIPVASRNRCEVTTKYVSAHSKTFTARRRKTSAHRIQIHQNAGGWAVVRPDAGCYPEARTMCAGCAVRVAPADGPDVAVMSAPAMVPGTETPRLGERPGRGVLFSGPVLYSAPWLPRRPRPPGGVCAG